VAEVEEYLEVAKLPHGIDNVIRSNLKIGEVSEEERDAIQKSTRALLSKREGSPFRKGPRTKMPFAVEVIIKEVGLMVYRASIVYWNNIPKGLILKHKKSGNGPYLSSDEYADVESRKARTNLERRYRSEDWDGTLESLK
tara:strand:+ start:173 stop:592 length:420 start_codon:yes stop_codon:yes gene_type:complete